MPKIIRKALYERLCNLPELRALLEDFSTLTGVSLRLVNEFGSASSCPEAKEGLCGLVQSTAKGRNFCARTRQSLLASSTENVGIVTCDAGFQEAAVPVLVGGIPAGYLVYGGVRSSGGREWSASRVAHLLRRAGVDVSAQECEELAAKQPVVSDAKISASRRMLVLAARQISLRLTEQVLAQDEPMPRVVKKAVALIRKRALHEDLRFSALAGECGVSEGHLSRLFHRSTGLTFREYIARLRVEKARELLLSGDATVTEVAFECGFNSVSQFNRAFRAIFKTSPTGLRKTLARTVR